MTQRSGAYRALVRRWASVRICRLVSVAYFNYSLVYEQ